MSLIVKERVARFTSSRLCWAKCDAVEGREMNFSSRQAHPYPFIQILSRFYPYQNQDKILLKFG